MATMPRIVATVALFVFLIGPALGQTSTGSISGTISDQNQALITGAVVTVRSTATGFARSITTNSEGQYSFLDLPIGAYELTIEAPSFSKYIRTHIQLLVNQKAVVSPTLTPGSVNADVVVNSDTSLLNTITPEVATQFDERRLSELPIAPNRNLYNVLLSVPGASPRANGLSPFMLSMQFSINGGRIRSNSFLLDGQDINDPVLTGSNMPLNNPDAIQEVRIVTNQFLPEYGHNASSIINVVGK